MKKRTGVVLLVIVLALAAVSAIRIASINRSAVQRPASTPVVKVGYPVRQTMTRSLQFTGDLLPIQQAQIFAKVYGNLDAVYVQMGDFVRTGQLLAVVDTTELVSQYNGARASYEYADSVFARTKILYERNLTSREDFENAQTARKVAATAYDNAKTELGYARITAPFSGIITRRYLDPGAVLTSSNATLFTLMDLDTMKVIVNLSERDVPSVTEGTPAVVTADAYPEAPFDGKVVRLAEALDPATRTMPIEIDITNKSHLLKGDMYASVTLIIGAEDSVLTLPTQAVLHDGRGSYVYLARNDTAYRRDVRVGIEQESLAAITGGLNDSDEVIVVGQQFAKDHEPIRVQK